MSSIAGCSPNRWCEGLRGRSLGSGVPVATATGERTSHRYGPGIEGTFCFQAGATRYASPSAQPSADASGPARGLWLGDSCGPTSERPSRSSPTHPTGRSPRQLHGSTPTQSASAQPSAPLKNPRAVESIPAPVTIATITADRFLHTLDAD
jgi:hypothetical protein